MGTVDLERRIERLEKRVFGEFTRDDVASLRVAATIMEWDWGDTLDNRVTNPASIRSVADRIEARISPEVS